jgi:hypothetical protein
VGVGLSLRTVRTKTAKLTTEMNSQAAEMYDLTADPHELTNIFDSPEHAQLRDQLISLLMKRPDDIQPNATPVGMA